MITSSFEIGSRVKARGQGVGTLLGVRGSLAQVSWDSGYECCIPLEKLSLHREHKAQPRESESLIMIRSSSESYRVAGYLAHHMYGLYLSVPEHRLSIIDDLQSNSIDIQNIKVIHGEASIGESYHVVFPNSAPFVVGSFISGTEVLINKVPTGGKSIASTYFIRDFLLKELGFVIGGRDLQDPVTILSKIPDGFKFKEAFNEGYSLPH